MKVKFALLLCLLLVLCGCQSEELPEWCINGNTYYQKTELQQYYYDGDDAKDIVDLLISAEGYYQYTHDGFVPFDRIEDASLHHLIYSALLSTPEAQYGSPITYDDGKVIADNPDDPIIKALAKVYTETDIPPMSHYLVEDVKITFRYLYGDQAIFIPSEFAQYGFVYNEDADIFMRFEESPVSGRNIPQIKSVTEENGIYTVTAIWTPAYAYFDFDGNKIEDPKDSDSWLEFDETVYKLRKAKDGRFILCGVSE